MIRRAALAAHVAAGNPAANRTAEVATPLPPLLAGRRIAVARARIADGREGEAVYRRDRLTASYVHFYFPSNPAATAELFSN